MIFPSCFVTDIPRLVFRGASGYNPGVLSADLGGRVGWLPKAERVKTLLPQNVGGGGVGGGIPPGRNLRGLGGFCGEKAQAPGGPGPKPWGPGPQAPWRPGPQAPGAWIPPLSPVDFLPSF